MKKALTVPSGNCGKVVFFPLQRVEARKDEQLKEPEWGPVEGAGAQGRREVTKGRSWTFTQLGLKERNL